MDSLSTDPLVGVSKAATVSFDTIPDVEGLSDTPRVNQQSILPTSIQARSIGNIIYSSGSGLNGGTYTPFTIPAGASASFVFKLVDDSKRVILAVPDIGLYLGTVTSATEWPVTGGIGLGTMPVVIYNDWGLTDNVNVVTRVVWRNTQNVDQPVIVVCRWRVITNATPVQSQANTTVFGDPTATFTVIGKGGGP